MVVNMLGVYDLSWQAGLPFVWLRMPKGWRASSFARRAEAELAGGSGSLDNGAGHDEPCAIR